MDYLAKRISRLTPASKRSLKAPSPEPRQIERILPTELWIIVLNIFVNPDGPCRDRYNSIDFPCYKFEQTIVHHFSPTNTDFQIKQLRLVCRLWSSILDPKWKPYLKTMNQLDIIKYTDIRILSIDCILTPKFFQPFALGQQLLSTTRNIHTLIITVPFIGQLSILTNYIFSVSAYFPNVRSFSFHADSSLPQDFFARFQSVFPRLITLALRIPESGEISHPYVETLELNTSIPPTFQFPNLKNFISYKLRSDFSYDQLLQGHSKRLESLLLPNYLPTGNDFFGIGFWTRFPALKLLGVKSSALSKLPRPPAGHPFNHLCLYQPGIEEVKILVDYLPSLRYISVTGLGDSEGRAKEVLLMDEFLRSRGMAQLDSRLYGRAISPKLYHLQKQGLWQTTLYYAGVHLINFLCLWGYQQEQALNAQ